MGQTDNQEVGLRELVGILWKRKGLIVLVVLLAVIASALLSYFVLTPQYEASTEILVNQAPTEGQVNQGDIRTNIDLINTYSVIIKSPRILDIVLAENQFNLSYRQLHDRIEVNSVQNSQVMSVAVTDTDYTRAASLVNAIASTFQREVVSLMNIDNVHIMAEAKADMNPAPVRPSPVLNIAIAFVIGTMLAIGLAFLLDYLDNSIKTEQDVEKYLDLPVIGTIAVIEEMEQGQAKKKPSKQAQLGGEQLEA
ncbi:YveK family protein [Bacillus horti]|uniref:Capsular polysaccharide biosynthesis protein n=1 Tax=Caldalkalibacillus horti TaxID=77523 RepID=A0ABT9VZH3_9BACI|nr:Wzz/FepE/Etk N-terminal domain-containing protein [Bacillus horti]MDQ0166383.1 capsular polysaccharide biosynthesis protein [Bacillus horti]